MAIIWADIARHGRSTVARISARTGASIIALYTNILCLEQCGVLVNAGKVGVGRNRSHTFRVVKPDCSKATVLTETFRSTHGEGKDNSLAARKFSRFVTKLQEGAHKTLISKSCGISIQAMARMIEVLHDAKAIHISGWWRNPTNRCGEWAAVYSIGRNDDVAPPARRQASELRESTKKQAKRREAVRTRSRELNCCGYSVFSLATFTGSLQSVPEDLLFVPYRSRIAAMRKQWDPRNECWKMLDPLPKPVRQRPHLENAPEELRTQDNRNSPMQQHQELAS